MRSEVINMTKRRIARSADIIGLVERYVTAVMMIVMTALYAFNVLVRLFFPLYASAFAWIDEAARYLMIWVVFLAAGITLEVGRHVCVDIAYNLLPQRVVRSMFSVIDVVGFVFSLAASYYSLSLVLFVASTGQISPTLGIPAFVLYAAPFIGFLLLAFRYLLRLTNIRDARRSPVKAEWLGGAHS